MAYKIVTIDPPPKFAERVEAYAKQKFNVNVKCEVLKYYDGFDADSINGNIITDYYGLKRYNVTNVNSLKVADIAERLASEHIKHKTWFTDDLEIAKKWLATYDAKYSIIAADFETTGLLLPHYTDLTMLSLSWSYTKSTVIVINSNAMKELVLDWLTTTKLKQVWFNALYDVKLIHHFTGKFPKDVEDAMLLGKVYRNHINPVKRKVNLKDIAGNLYGKWATAKESFDLYDTTLNNTVDSTVYVGSGDSSKYNLALIAYAGIDSSATKLAWEKFANKEAKPDKWIMPTSEPKDNVEQFNQRYFYDFILKPAIPVVIEMMNNGQAIDLEQVKQLESEVKEFNKKKLEEINSIPIVKEFIAKADKERIEKFLEPVKKALKKPKGIAYKNNIAMRTFVVNYWDNTDFEKVSAKDLKELDTEICKILLAKDFEHPKIKEAVRAYEKMECRRQNINANRIDKIEHPEKYVDLGFNPYNYKQLTQMWLYMGLESDEISKKTGEMSFSSDVLRELANTTSGDVQKAIKAYLDIAQSKNLLTQYIPKYYGSTVDGRVYGSLVLLGTISARLSGKSPKIEGEDKHKVGINLVTQPSSNPIYGSTVKKMFIAPKGKILASSDYNNLEGHIGAILTKDETSLITLKEKFDTHVLHSAVYWQDQWEKITSIKFDMKSLEVNKKYKEFTKKDVRCKNLRQDSKGVTFAASYGAFPPKLAKSMKAPLEEGERIFDLYHNVLYSGKTKYRDEYVLPTVKEKGYIHLNWGLKLYSDDAEKDIRTLNNATMQSYSDLTLIAGIRLREEIYKHNLQDRIKLVNIIHDALYLELDDDLEVIKFVNDNLPRIMKQQFLFDQPIDLGAEVDFGYDLYNVVTLEADSSIEEIKEQLKEIRDAKTKDTG